MIHRSSRRKFLKRTSLIALAPTIPQFLYHNSLEAMDATNGKILVVIQLDGSNDGINTLVPYTDEGYAKYRTALRIPTDKLIKVSDSVGLHPAMRPAADLLEDGRRSTAISLANLNDLKSVDKSTRFFDERRVLVEST